MLHKIIQYIFFYLKEQRSSPHMKGGERYVSVTR